MHIYSYTQRINAVAVYASALCEWVFVYLTASCQLNCLFVVPPTAPPPSPIALYVHLSVCLTVCI